MTTSSALPAGPSANLVHEARQALGMTQQQFARTLCADLRTVRRWELGEITPSNTTLVAIRNTLILDEITTSPSVFGALLAGQTVPLSISSPERRALIVRIDRELGR